jgi:tetratricopeptide (TPR) repeat protein
VAPYLCLAEFAANDGDWKRVAELSDRALALDPLNNPYSLYYSADAGLHLNQFAQAEMHAQAAVKLDPWHKLPELHLLLAQIYRASGNVQGEVAQLHEFLKEAPNFQDASTARDRLTRIETPPTK